MNQPTKRTKPNPVLKPFAAALPQLLAALAMVKAAAR
jgi:hypothetical protein